MAESDVAARMKVLVEAPGDKLDNDLRSVEQSVMSTGSRLKDVASSALVPLASIPGLFDDAVVTANSLVDSLAKLPTEGLLGSDEIDFKRLDQLASTLGNTIEQSITNEIDAANESGFDLNRTFETFRDLIAADGEVGRGLDNMIRTITDSRAAADDLIMSIRRLPGVNVGQGIRGFIFPEEARGIAEAEATINRQGILAREMEERAKRADELAQFRRRLDRDLELSQAQTPEELRAIRTRHRREDREESAFRLPRSNELRDKLLEQIDQIYANELMEHPRLDRNANNRVREMRAQEFDLVNSALGTMPKLKQPDDKPANQQQAGDMIELLRSIDKNTRARITATPIAG